MKNLLTKIQSTAIICKTILIFLRSEKIMSKNEEKTSATNEEVKQPAILWNDKEMKSTYINATNVVAGREEVQMLLGMNQAWQMGQDKVNVDLVERVVMSPYTAKRLAFMLSATISAYEKKYGKIELSIEK